LLISFYLMRSFSQEELDDMRIRLMAAGKELISRFGLAKTTVRDICSAARVAPGSFYLFFPSKDDLYAEILVAAVAEQRGRNASAAASAAASEAAEDAAHGDPERTIRGFLSRMIADIEGDPILAQFHRRDSMAEAKRALVAAKGGAAFAQISSGLDTVIAGWLEAGIARGEAADIRKIVQALIYLALNRSEIAGGAGPGIVESYIGFVAAGLASGTRTQRGRE
jgi:AcrR family transcriptional regulator